MLARCVLAAPDRLDEGLGGPAAYYALCSVPYFPVIPGHYIVFQSFLRSLGRRALPLRNPQLR